MINPRRVLSNARNGPRLRFGCCRSGSWMGRCFRSRRNSARLIWTCFAKRWPSLPTTDRQMATRHPYPSSTNKAAAYTYEDLARKLLCDQIARDDSKMSPNMNVAAPVSTQLSRCCRRHNSNFRSKARLWAYHSVGTVAVLVQRRVWRCMSQGR